MNSILIGNTGMYWHCPDGTDDIWIDAIPGFPAPTEDEVEQMLLMLAHYLETTEAD